MLKSTTTTFQMFLKDNKPKMMTNYPFLSHSQIISRLKLQWKKLMPKNTTSKAKSHHCHEKSKLQVNKCNVKEPQSLKDVFVKKWWQHSFNMQDFDLFNDGLKIPIPSSNNHDSSQSSTSKIISGSNNSNNNSTASQVCAVSINKKRPATFSSLDMLPRKIKTYSNHSFEVRHRVPEVFMNMEKFSRVGILKSPSKMKKPINVKVGFLPTEKPLNTSSDLYDFGNSDVKTSDFEESNSRVSTIESQSKVAFGLTAINKLKSRLEKKAEGINFNNTNQSNTKLNYINVNNMNEDQSNVQIKSLSKSVAAAKPSNLKIRFSKSIIKKPTYVTIECQKECAKKNIFEAKKCTPKYQNTISKSPISVRKQQNKNNIMPLVYEHGNYNTKGWNDDKCDYIPKRTNNGTLFRNRSSLITKSVSGKKKNMKSVNLELTKPQVIEQENDSNNDNEYSDQYEYNEEDAVLLFRTDSYMSSDNLNNLGVDEKYLGGAFDDSVNINNGHCSENEILDSQNNSCRQTSSQHLYSDYSDKPSLCDTYSYKVKKKCLPSASENERVSKSLNIHTRSRAKEINTSKFCKTDTTYEDSKNKENIVLKPKKVNSCAASSTSTIEFKRFKGEVDETIVPLGKVITSPHNVTDVTSNPVSAAEIQNSNCIPSTKRSNIRNSLFQKKGIENNYKVKNLLDINWDEENSEDFCSKMVSESTEILLQAIKKLPTIGSTPRCEDKNFTCLELSTSPTSSKSQDELDPQVMPTNKTYELTCSLKGNKVIGKLFDDIKVPSKVDTLAKRRLLLSGELKSNSNFQDLFDEKDVFF